ncbi:MAG: thioredoxin domain-containing protein [Bryobacteraceae bacterium]|nr:thioredoxin domain-containing protein [Bryobacteraceae bacterium]
MSDSNRLIEGNPAAAVRLHVYEDLQCGDCARLQKLIDERILPALGKRIAVEYFDFPLPKHNWARAAAIAARHFERISAKAGGAFRREVVGNIAQVSASSIETWIRVFARYHSLDGGAAIAALSEAELAAAVDRDIGSGIDRGVRKTPTVFLGSIAFIETFVYEDLATMIESALRREESR